MNERVKAQKQTSDVCRNCIVKTKSLSRLKRMERCRENKYQHKVHRKPPSVERSPGLIGKLQGSCSSSSQAYELSFREVNPPQIDQIQAFLPVTMALRRRQLLVYSGPGESCGDT